MSDPARDDLNDLKERIAEAQRRHNPVDSSSESAVSSSGKFLGVGLRAGIELVSGILVGTVMGIVLDRWMGTAPWGFLGLFCVGAVAGFFNIYRMMKGQELRVGLGKLPEQDQHKGP